MKQTGRSLGAGSNSTCHQYSMESSMFGESSEEKSAIPNSVLQNLLLKVSSF